MKSWCDILHKWQKANTHVWLKLKLAWNWNDSVWTSWFSMFFTFIAYMFNISSLECCGINEFDRKKQINNNTCVRRSVWTVSWTWRTHTDNDRGLCFHVANTWGCWSLFCEDDGGGGDDDWTHVNCNSQFEVCVTSLCLVRRKAEKPPYEGRRNPHTPTRKWRKLGKGQKDGESKEGGWSIDGVSLQNVKNCSNTSAWWSGFKKKSPWQLVPNMGGVFPSRILWNIHLPQL